MVILQALRLQIAYKFDPSNIYTMDETPVWSDMVGTTTVTKKVSSRVLLKSTGHKKPYS